MRFCKAKLRQVGTKAEANPEQIVDQVGFNIFKFNNRPKPVDSRQVLIISCLSEFGCEVLGAMYCVPKILRENAGKYSIVVGWYGRDYLYRHLVDEFWEVKEEFQWMRDYCRAFHHDSKNLRFLEHSLKSHGRLIPSRKLGELVVGNRCYSCNMYWGGTTKIERCKFCGSEKIDPSLFADVNRWKPTATKIPKPNEFMLSRAKEFLGPMPVGVFARGRTTYGRNLQPEFYVKLVKLLRSKGYSPIWLGEKQSTQPCPVPDVLDFSRMEEARNLELTLAIIAQCNFTVQFWTASTRLASMVETPYLLFESPDQIWGTGQEGYRRNLCDFGHRKLAVCHFLNVYNNNDAGISLVDRCIDEMEVGNWEDVIGLIESDIAVEAMKRDNAVRIGEII